MTSSLDSKFIYAVKGITLDKSIRDPVLLGTIMSSAVNLKKIFEKVSDDETKEKHPDREKTCHHLDVVKMFADYYSKKVPQNRKLLITNVKFHCIPGQETLICAEYYSVKVGKHD